MGDERKQDDEEKFDDVQSCCNRTQWRLHNIKPVIVTLMLWMMMMMMMTMVVVNIPCALAADDDVGLRVDFYNTSCPDVEGIILNAVTQKLQASPKAGSGVLRLYFHDAFVSGFDASILLTSTPGGGLTERDADKTLPVEGFDLVAWAKKAVEAQCPCVVSCADVLAMATRDAIVKLGGTPYPVLKGRRDSRVSKAADVAGNLPSPADGVDNLLALFTAKGLDINDLVALSGAHTIGFSHCDQFIKRLYPSTDACLDPSFACGLKAQCPQSTFNPDTQVALDAVSSFVFDNAYYKDVMVGKGLLASDNALVLDNRTRPQVVAFSEQPSAFFAAFGHSMTKLGGLGVLTNTEGEIRSACDCGCVN